MARAPGTTSRRQAKAIPGTELNLGKALRDNIELWTGGMLAEDSFRGEVMLILPVPRPGVDATVPAAWAQRPVTDIDITHILEWFQANNYAEVGVDRVRRAVDAEAHRNRFSSAKRWLDGLPAWDGTVRLDYFFDEVCGASEADEWADEESLFRSVRYLAAIGRAFFISICARIVEPGCQVDTVVVLEGMEGISKTNLLRTLASREDWFTDSFPNDLRDKDAMQALPGNLIVELAELEQLRSTRNFGAIKNFLSRKFDKYRRSYGRQPITQLRQNVFVGTTNDTDYMPDSGGTRRFWPVYCSMIDIDRARAWLDQLYAEALAAYRDGEKWHLDGELEEIAREVRSTREIEDPWEEMIASWVDGLERNTVISGEQFLMVGTNEAVATIDPDLVKSERRGAEMRAAKIMKRLGFQKRKTRTKDGKTPWKWVRRLEQRP